jgi:hypothetical protein
MYRQAGYRLQRLATYVKAVNCTFSVKQILPLRAFELALLAYFCWLA